MRETKSVDYQFVRELRDLINKHSLESGSDTPDYLLAEYLTECLLVYNQVMNKREKWYKPTETVDCPGCSKTPEELCCKGY